MSIAASTRTAAIPAAVDRVAGYAGVVRRISWGAIFAGVIIAIVVQLLLGLLGLGIGFASVDPATATESTGRGAAIGAAIWWAASSLIALFLGGWVAGRLAGFPRASEGGLHGVVAWAAMTIFSIYLVTTAVGSIVGGALNVVGQGLQTAGQAAVEGAVKSGDQSGALSAMTEDPSIREMKDKAKQALQNPQSTAAQLDATMDKMFTKDAQGRTKINREELITQLTQNGKMDRAQAEQTVNEWDQTLQQAQQKMAQMKQDVKQTASEARKPMAKAAIWSFVALSLGALAAGLGGRLGAPRTLAFTGSSAVPPMTPTSGGPAVAVTTTTPAAPVYTAPSSTGSFITTTTNTNTTP
jgi:hypothetical protein